MKTYVNCDAFNIGGANIDNSVGRAWKYWANQDTINKHFENWLKDEYKLDLFRRIDNGHWELSGDEKDVVMFMLRWS